MAKTIVLTQADHSRLSKVLDVNSSFGDEKVGHCIRELNSDLKSASIVGSGEIPADVVTMNSRVVIRDLSTNEDEEWMLCFPNNADIFENRLSVLAPMGIAMLGQKTGDVIAWETPKGAAQATIMSISYQPEAAGDLHL